MDSDRSKTHKRLKERFLIRPNRKNVQIFEVINFFKLRTVQQKTVKPTYLCPLDARKLAEGNGHETAYSNCSFNLLCFGSFFRTLAVNSVSDFFFFLTVTELEGSTER